MNKFQETTKQIDTVISEYERLMKETRNVLQEHMKGIFKSFFEAHPLVKTIHWRQYTPHFNDGDDCVFDVHEPWFTMTEYTDLTEREHVYGEGDEGLIETRIWNDKSGNYEMNQELDPQLVKDMNVLATLIQCEANEAVFLAMFDNHVWVKAHKDGFDIDDYDHD